MSDYFKAGTPQMTEDQIRPFVEGIRAVRNETHYLLGMMEKLSGEMARLKVAVTPKINEATAITNINEWSDSTFAKIREISRAKGVYDRDIIREICKDERFAGIDFTELKDDTISDNANLYKDQTIEETIESLKTGWELVVFWIFWIILIIALVIGFYYIDNNWLEDKVKRY